ncbi:MAG TPA: hypothetical protein ENI87_12200 [bacterium]|nr:hypothetical protein [bacterium]
MHVVAYACLGGSIWLAWSRRPRAARVPMRSLGAWLVAGLYGIVDEVHQSFVPGRDCSVADALSDAAGAALAVLLLRGATGEGPVRWSALASVAAMAAASVLFATFA